MNDEFLMKYLNNAFNATLKTAVVITACAAMLAIPFIAGYVFWFAKCATS